MKDLHGRLYFAASNTRHDRLASTAVSSAFVNEQMERSRASAKVALLDCCYSGAFAKGLTPKSAPTGNLAGQICGRGSYVITATNSLEYAYEGTGITEDHAMSSSFTELVVTGLKTGRADWDGDGLISPEDLYWYLDKEFRSAGKPQTPTSFSSGVQGAIHIAQARRVRDARSEPVRETGLDVSARHEVDRHLRDLEVRYASIREVLPSGGRRTALLDDIPAEAGAVSARAQRVGLLAPRVRSFVDDSDAARVVTLALCERVEEPAQPVAEAIVDAITHSRSAFEQYWALHAGCALMRRLSPECRSLVRDAAQAMLDSGIAATSTNRVSLAHSILNHPDTDTRS